MLDFFVLEGHLPILALFLKKKKKIHTIIYISLLNIKKKNNKQALLHAGSVCDESSAIILG